MNGTWLRHALILMLCLLPVCCNADESEWTVKTTPLHDIRWEGRGGGFRSWHCGGEYLYGVSVKPEVLDIWKWSKDTLVPERSLELEPSLTRQWLDGDRYLVSPLGEDGLVLKRADDKQVVKRWPYARGWDCEWSRVSRNGRWVAVGLLEDFTNPPPGFDWDKRRVHLGRLGVSQEAIKWLPMLRANERGAVQISALACSDDGAYVAAAGWNWGAAMIDVAADRVLWEARPRGETASKDLAFSPDSKVVYVGGTQGCVYGMDVRTGTIATRWFATRTGQEEYAHRITTVAVSADGRFVAAGTGPEGEVYAWHAATGKPVGLFFHGLSTVELVMFSTDSKYLASFVPGSIKVWQLPEAAAQPAATDH